MALDNVSAQFPRRRRVKQWMKRVASWKRWGELGVAVAVAALALGLVANARTSDANKHNATEAKTRAQQVAVETQARTQQLQDAFCGTTTSPGLLPTILKAHVTPETSQLGFQILVGARHAAQILQCPGAH
jgi:hypothetical protein